MPFAFLRNTMDHGPATPVTPREDSVSEAVAAAAAARPRAVDEALKMQALVIREAIKDKRDPPKYALAELIGKGSYGSVYKSKDMTNAAVVAVKIIDIDESDTANPREANSFDQFLKEVTTLKTLKEKAGFKNINRVIEALSVGKTMWIVTEYCGGGSVSTLMKAVSPSGLHERFIIPIIREVAEAVKFVHEAGIIHRDLKCANVLVTETGLIKLCDFGVAGTMENKKDKRSTCIGTPHWMAPELFSENPRYGKEVDIWAFGAMVFELATGAPPNANLAVPYASLGDHLRRNAPRLVGGTYSPRLRGMVAFCLNANPRSRPTIQQVEGHEYIYGTRWAYPTPSMTYLLRQFAKLENRKNRESLYVGSTPDTRGQSSSQATPEAWDFDTESAFGPASGSYSTSQASGSHSTSQASGSYSTGQDLSIVQGQQSGFQRPSPLQFSSQGSSAGPSGGCHSPWIREPLPSPLEKVFDANTQSSYRGNSISQYGESIQSPLLAGDQSRRNAMRQLSLEATLIDLDVAAPPSALTSGMGALGISDLQPQSSSIDYEDEDAMYPYVQAGPSEPSGHRCMYHNPEWQFGLTPESAGRTPSSPTEALSYDVPVHRNYGCGPGTQTGAGSYEESTTGGAQSYYVDKYVSQDQPVQTSHRMPSMYVETGVQRPSIDSSGNANYASNANYAGNGSYGSNGNYAGNGNYANVASGFSPGPEYSQLEPETPRPEFADHGHRSTSFGRIREAIPLFRFGAKRAPSFGARSGNFSPLDAPKVDKKGKGKEKTKY